MKMRQPLFGKDVHLLLEKCFRWLIIQIGSIIPRQFFPALTSFSFFPIVSFYESTFISAVRSNSQYSKQNKSAKQKTNPNVKTVIGLNKEIGIFHELYSSSL